MNEKEILVNNITSLLEEYDYPCSHSGINEIIDTWATNKAPLIEAFKRHPNYVEGKFLIAFDSDFEREVDSHVIAEFIRYILYLGINVNDSQRIWIKIHMRRIKEQFLTEEQVKIINELFPTVHAHNGQKTTRVINKIMTVIGATTDPNYNREFAKYADTLNPLKITRHTVLSINPMDFYTMSFGNSWASCHTIDKENRRGMPNSYEGMYSSGTESYMLDESSMVFYTVDAAYNGTDYWTQPKMNRQMFHFGEDKLVQGRLYPQDNDNNPTGYTPCRNIVQEIVAKIFNKPNYWSLHKGSNFSGKYILSRGTHYRDYTCFDNCTLSIFKDSTNGNTFFVGHNPICPCCGEEHRINENICCDECAPNGEICESCGCRIDTDDAIWINDYAYCRDCVYYCDCCEEYVLEETTYISSQGQYVCDDCLSNSYTYCDRCGEYHLDRFVSWIDSVYQNVCDDCLSEEFERCNDCDEYYLTDELVEINGDWVCQNCAEEREKNA